MTQSIHGAQLAGAIEAWPAADKTADCSTDAAVILALDWSDEPVDVRPDNLSAQEMIFIPFIEDDENVGVPRPLKTHEGRTFIELAIDAAREAGIERITVVVPRGERRLDRRLKGSGAVVKRLRKFDAKQPGGSLFGLTPQVLDICAQASEGATGAFVLTAQQPRIKAEHLAELKANVLATAARDAGVSWAEWRIVPPLYLTAELFDRGDLHARITPVDGVLAIPDFSVTETVFGEQRLIGSSSNPAGFDGLIGPDEPTAATALGIASGVEFGDEGPLVDVARAYLEAPSPLAASFGTKLDEADAWARRNRLDFAQADIRDAAGEVFLDSGATTQRLRAALDAAAEFDHHSNANAYRGTYATSTAATITLAGARGAVAAFIGAEDHQVAFTKNATDSINTVARAWGSRNLKPGDRVAVCAAEHHANLLPWELLRDTCGIELDFFEVGADGRIDMDSYAAALERGPKLVAVAHMGNVLGIVNPVAKMAAMAHDAGARILVDAAQSVAHLPIDVGELDCDFLAFSGHKIYAPQGIGVLYACDEAVEELAPCSVGGGTVTFVGRNGFSTRRFPALFEAGTLQISQAAGLAKAVQYLSTLGMDTVAGHARTLSRYALARVADLPWLSVWGDHTGEDGAHGVMSFDMDGISSQAAATLMGKLGVSVRGDSHCAVPLTTQMGCSGTLRLSTGVYTTTADIDAFIVAATRTYDLMKDAVRRW